MVSPQAVAPLMPEALKSSMHLIFQPPLLQRCRLPNRAVRTVPSSAKSCGSPTRPVTTSSLVCLQISRRISSSCAVVSPMLAARLILALSQTFPFRMSSAVCGGAALQLPAPRAELLQGNCPMIGKPVSRALATLSGQRILSISLEKATKLAPPGPVLLSTACRGNGMAMRFSRDCSL